MVRFESVDEVPSIYFGIEYKLVRSSRKVYGLPIVGNFFLFNDLLT